MRSTFKNNLPKKIIILITESCETQKVMDEIMSKLEVAKNKIQATLTECFSLKKNVPFHLQKTLGYSLNLAEQINLLKNEIEIFSIDLNVIFNKKLILK